MWSGSRCIWGLDGCHWQGAAQDTNRSMSQEGMDEGKQDMSCMIRGWVRSQWQHMQ